MWVIQISGRRLQLRRQSSSKRSKWEAAQQVLVESISKKTRKNYSRKEKLKVAKISTKRTRGFQWIQRRWCVGWKLRNNLRQQQKEASEWNSDRRVQYPELEAKLYVDIGVHGSAEERIEGERMVVLSMCEADSHWAGARYQLQIFQCIVCGLQEMPPNKHEASHHTCQKISVRLYRGFIATFAEKQLRESKLDLWVNELHAK